MSEDVFIAHLMWLYTLHPLHVLLVVMIEIYIVTFLVYVTVAFWRVVYEVIRDDLKKYEVRIEAEPAERTSGRVRRKALTADKPRNLIE